MVKYLIAEKYYSPLHRDDGASIPLYYASLRGHLEVVKFLVEIAPDTINAHNEECYTPLMGATAGGHLQIIDYLFEKSELNFTTFEPGLPFPVYEFDIEIYGVRSRNWKLESSQAPD